MALVPLRQLECTRAGDLLQGSLTLFRKTGDRAGAADALYYLGLAAYYQGDQPRAQALLEENLTGFRELGVKMASPRAPCHMKVTHH